MSFRNHSNSKDENVSVMGVYLFIYSSNTILMRLYYNFIIHYHNYLSDSFTSELSIKYYACTTRMIYFIKIQLLFQIKLKSTVNCDPLYSILKLCNFSIKNICDVWHISLFLRQLKRSCDKTIINMQ